jgi:hypothetical protein
MNNSLLYKILYHLHFQIIKFFWDHNENHWVTPYVIITSWCTVYGWFALFIPKALEKKIRIMWEGKWTLSSQWKWPLQLYPVEISELERREVRLIRHNIISIFAITYSHTFTYIIDPSIHPLIHPSIHSSIHSSIHPSIHQIPVKHQ